MRRLTMFLLSAFFTLNLYAQNSDAAKVQENDPPATVPNNATRSAFLMMGNRAGQQAVWKTADGVQHVLFEFNDRGRGPRTVTDYHFDSKGLVSSAKTIGHDYYKASSEESYSLSNNTAQWKNRSEQGSRALSRPSFYLGMFTPPEEIAMLVRTALVNGGSVDLLPAGNARVNKVAERILHEGDKQAKVFAYSVTGLDFSPSYVWLDEQNNFFAAGETWAMLIREGFEPSAKMLVEAQEHFQSDRSHDLVAKLRHKPQGDLLIRNVSVFDAATATLVSAQDVLVSGNKIKSVTPTGAAPKGVQVIDGSRKYLLPGLWDLHAHVSGNDGLLNIAAGVTTVRDMGNDVDNLAARIRRIDSGLEIGTRIIPCGLIDGPGPYQGPTKLLAANEAEARAIVDRLAGLGYPQMKIYSSLKPELVPVVIDEAKKHHMRVSGHIPAGMTAQQAVEAGYDEIQHANFLMLNFMPEVKDTNTPTRFTEVAKRGADLDLTSSNVRDFVAFLKRKGTDLDVTLSVFEDMFVSRPGVVSPTFAPVADRLPPQIKRGALSSGLPVPEGMDQRYRDSYAKMEQLVKVMYDAGIPIESGTDSIAGFALEREFELHQKIGIPAAKVLQDATLGAARIMSKDTELGSVTPGKLADLVLIEGDPTRDVSALRNTRAVIKDGFLYYPAEIDQELGIKP